jgi:hypothetical protein
LVRGRNASIGQSLVQRQPRSVGVKLDLLWRVAKIELHLPMPNPFVNQLVDQVSDVKRDHRELIRTVRQARVLNEAYEHALNLAKICRNQLKILDGLLVSAQ